MKPFARAERVGEMVQRVLADVLRREISDPRLDLTTITAVRMSRDLKHARVYFAVGGDNRLAPAAEKGFASAMGYLKRRLGEELSLRYMPALQFHYDESFDYGDRIDRIIDAISSEHESDHPSA
jgi:ribosome-binding factor A